MTRTAVRRTGRATIAALMIAAGAAVASLTAAPASAQPSPEEKNQIFMDFLDKKNVPYKNRTEAIRMAKEFCLDAKRQGNPDWLAGYNLQYKGGWSQTEAETFVEGAVYVYCPKVWGVE
ncbi:DUF732 domain-containing protein [Mycobacterium deserti]|uniref:DUF732 domain-containing protein n=1 Tax=Mycobacterium deserti TaxID=2978347 RepID=A0ABT2MFX8_9MYCO|nr:DUF732 domain-containing protein [Mycobacterium deserti]MCT7659911.1 DUF732 domain-containing protein [Mycobacterium deserti]